MSEHKNKYLGIDPGHTSGWCTFDEAGLMTGFGQVIGLDDFMDFVEELDPQPETIIMEDYIIRKGISHAGSRAPTIQLIGMIKRYAKKHNVQMILQPSTVKQIGYRFAGLKPSGSHDNSHQYDAIAHACFYLQKHGIRESRITAK